MIDEKNQPDFPGIAKPSIDFQFVRDQRRATLLYLDVDLSSARSFAAGSQLTLPIIGNAFYADCDLTATGDAVVHFQDSVNAGSAPVFVSPGFIARVPFTQIVIENDAQAGKRMRIFYGVDVDFVPGQSSQIAISGTVDNSPLDYTTEYASTTALAANTPETIFTPAANVKGAILSAAKYISFGSAGGIQFGFIAKSSAPANILDGDLIVFGAANNVGMHDAAELQNEILIPAGKGLYRLTSAAETLPIASCLYSFL